MFFGDPDSYMGLITSFAKIFFAILTMGNCFFHFLSLFTRAATENAFKSRGCLLKKIMINVEFKRGKDFERKDYKCLDKVNRLKQTCYR